MKFTPLRSDWHAKIYIFGLALLVSCLPLSRYLLSIAQFLLAINWIAEANFQTKFRRIRDNPSVLLFASVFLLYAVGLLFTENLKPGVEKVKNALPFLMLPFVIGSSEPLSDKNTRRLLLLFSFAVITASVVCLINYIIKGIPPGGDFRQISVFMPHLRFALLIDMAIAILLYFSFVGNAKYYLPAALYLTGFLLFLRSATGIAVFVVILTFILLKYALHTGNKQISRLISLATLVLYAGLISWLSYLWFTNFYAQTVHSSSLENHTVNGNPYVHDSTTGLLENGNYTDLYICEVELRKEWNNVSSLKFDGLDQKGQILSSTLKRYLTSRGLRKDSAGISQLSPSDIANIENGMANYRFSEFSGISQRIYEILYEIHVYRKTGFAKQHSAGQRLVFLKSGISLISDIFPFGVGTGDVYESLKKRTQSLNLEIDPEWEGKPHNQFVFLILAFGLPGIIWILICWIFPVAKSKSYRFLLFNIFITISFLSMLVMDTLESYDSIVFFAFFYCLFVFGQQKSNSYT